MRAEDDMISAPSLPLIDPRSVPRTALDWPAAFRLRPARLPASDPLSLFGESCDDLRLLKDLTSPAARHKSGAVPLPFDVLAGTSEPVLSGFANSLPEWRFADRNTAHMVLGSSIAAAVAVAVEIYGRFMRDTKQAKSTLSFAVERFRLAGSFCDVSDMELFPGCYSDAHYGVPQKLVAALKSENEAGLVFDALAGQAAVILKPELLVFAGNERGLALEWDGARFERVYDYRDMYWRDLLT